MRKVLATLAVLAVLSFAGGLLVLYSGIYNVAASQQHMGWSHWLLHTGMRQSIKAHAQDIAVPDLADRSLIESGLRQYGEHCVQCHGAPGVAPQDFALGLTPLAPNLVPTARTWPAEEIFWVIKHGIKMTGMPAWDYRMSDEDIWALTAFVKQLPALAPADYRMMVERIVSGREEAEHGTP